MIRKTFLTVAALLAISALGTSPARADIDIELNLGFDGGFRGKVSCYTGAIISIAASTRLCAAIAAAGTTSTRAAAMANGIISP
jgi:hypothetical protein